MSTIKRDEVLSVKQDPTCRRTNQLQQGFPEVVLPQPD